MLIEIGKEYKVEIYDCCVEAKFESELNAVYVEEEEDDVGEWIEKGEFELEYGTILKFKNGVEITCMNGVELKEV